MQRACLREGSRPLCQLLLQGFRERSTHASEVVCISPEQGVPPCLWNELDPPEQFLPLQCLQKEIHIPAMHMKNRNSVTFTPAEQGVLPCLGDELDPPKSSCLFSASSRECEQVLGLTHPSTSYLFRASSRRST